MTGRHAQDFPAHLSSDGARHLAQGTWSVRPVRSTRVELEGTFESSGKARRTVELHLRGFVGDVQMHSICLLASELITNAIKHGEGNNGVVLYLAASTTCVRVEVCDGGSGFDLPRAPRPAGAPGGHGLRILDRLASRWGVAGDGGTCVWFELDLV